MAVSAITSLKKVIGYKGNSGISNTLRNDSLDPVPTVGFRVGYKRNTNILKINVIGARHLPAKIGKTTVNGYIVKVKLYPGQEKYETDSKPESWPTYNQEFTFEITNAIPNRNKDLHEILNSGNFIVFTIYAEDHTKKKKMVIGAATWKLDYTLFQHKLHTDEYGENEELETPEIWKKTEEVSSGITGMKQKREEKNNQLEVSLRYTPGSPEEGESDSLSIGVTKLRWSIESTKEYEQKNAQLYVKLKVLEDDTRIIKEIKTRKFAPSISVHFRPEKDNSVLSVPLLSNRDCLTCQLSLCTKPTLGKKTVFGRVLIGPSCKTNEVSGNQWERTFKTPRVTFTQWHSIR